jgi:signal transduction histidine kinase
VCSGGIMSVSQELALVLIDPRYRRAHLIVIVVALALHLSLHYATYFPALRAPLGGLPYFRLHSLHEAEFLLIVAYAGVVLGLRAGITAVVLTGLTSIPFILTPYIFGRDPRPGELRDLTIQVVFILAMGLLITLLYDRDQRRRAAEGRNDTLSEVDRVRNNFMSMAAHELRAPLTSVLGYSELLLDDDIPREQARAWLASINNESIRLNGLIDELMNVARVESGNLELAIEPTDIRDAIDGAVLSAGGTSQAHMILVDVDAELPPIAADADKLRQILINLISNAIKYSPHGGDIAIRAFHSPGAVRVEIQDEGLGMIPEDQAKLFTRFHRIKTAQTEGIPGTGLGLTIVKSLVEMMQGTIDLTSAEGEGSTFGFTIPLWQEGAATSLAA